MIVDHYADMKPAHLIAEVDRRAREFQNAPLRRSQDDADVLAIAARMLSYHFQQESRQGLRHNHPGPRADYSSRSEYARADSPSFQVAMSVQAWLFDTAYGFASTTTAELRAALGAAGGLASAQVELQRVVLRTLPWPLDVVVDTDVPILLFRPSAELADPAQLFSLIIMGRSTEDFRAQLARRLTGVAP